TLDIVGTGGDLASTVNISTGSAILAAACGLPIAKHGNRSSSSLSGSADVLEVLEIDLEPSKEQLEQCIREIGIAFMFAPHYHPSLKRIASVRKGLKFPTVFNILGPLLNPAKAPFALIGVSSFKILDLMAEVILQLAYHQRVLLFHGSGLDELNPLVKGLAYNIHHDKINTLEIDPIALGFSPCTLKDLQGGDARVNARLLKEAFAGRQGAIGDALILNAGAGVWIFGHAPTLKDGIHI